MFPICYHPMCCILAFSTTRSDLPPLHPAANSSGIYLVQTFKAQIDRMGRPPAACPPPSPPKAM